MIIVILILYCVACFFTFIIGLFSMGDLSQETIDELWEKPWRLDSPLKMLFFVVFHGWFPFRLINMSADSFENFWNTNKRTQSFEKSWNKFWIKKLF